MPADYSALKLKDQMRRTRRGYEQKARLLLEEGRLQVTRVVPEADIYRGQVRGDSASIYHVEWNKDRLRWTCTCPAMGVCSHVRALQLVVVRA